MTQYIAREVVWTYTRDEIKYLLGLLAPSLHVPQSRSLRELVELVLDAGEVSPEEREDVPAGLGHPPVT